MYASFYLFSAYLNRRNSSRRGDSFSESSSESETELEDDIPERRQDANADLPSEYWQIGKIIKYLKVRDTIIFFNLAKTSMSMW